jgi:hypothetical protein
LGDNVKRINLKTKIMKGGKRKGAGRPKSAPTKTIAFRVKLDQVEPIKEIVKAYLERV